MKFAILFLLAFVAFACGEAHEDSPMGEPPTAEQGLYTISFNVPPGGLPQIDCMGSSIPSWSYYGSICTGEDNLRSTQLFWKYGRTSPYQTDGCVCVRVLDGPGDCWITTGEGPDIQRDKQKMRIARSNIGRPQDNWIHRDLVTMSGRECTVQVMRCQTSVGCPTNPVAF